MNNTHAPSALKNSFHTVEGEKQESFLKRVAERIKTFSEDTQAYYSKVADGAYTGIGTMLRGIAQKAKNSELCTILMRNTLFLSNFIFNAPRLSLEAAQKAIQFVASTTAASVVSAPVAAIQMTPLQAQFTTSFQYVSDGLSCDIEDYIEDETFAAKATATSIANNEFVGPLRSEVQSLAHDFIGNVISKDAFEEKASATLLEYQGIIYSQEDEQPAICCEKLDDIRSSFRSSTGTTDQGENPVLTFNRVTDVYSPEPEMQQQEKPAWALEPAYAIA